VLSKDFKKAVGKFPTGVTVISTVYNTKLWGFTANSFVSVSLEPQLVSFCLNKNAGSFQAFFNSNYFTISILASDQAEISKNFASKSEDKFANIDYKLTNDTKIPLIMGAVCHIECSKFEQFECGDHVIFVGEVANAEINDNKSPLVYFAKSYTELG
jgi:flavin reductase (DIM6/NTAB) family NADH-FMN oxidoreductase RutF